MGHITKRTEHQSYPVRHYMNMMFFILVTALALICIISFVTITIVKQQSTRYMQQTADLYMNRIDHDFAYINHYMGWTLVNDESLKNVEKSYGSDVTGFIKSNDALYKRFSELQQNYGQEYNFLLYLKKPHFMTNIAPMNLSYSDYQELTKQIESYVEDKKVYEQFYSHWTPVLVKGKYYVINIVPYYDRYLIGLLSADDLVRPLNQIDLGKNGYASLVDNNGTILTHLTSDYEKVSQNRTAATSPLSFIASKTGVRRAFSNASISVNMVIKFGAFEKIMIAQLLIVLLFLIITFMLSFIILYIKKRVLKPILNYSKNLSLIMEENEPLETLSSKISELELTKIKFKNLVEQIKQYKIDIYEQELEKQRIQLDYMKMQIKPHFFLNCLTTIYSMAQMQMHEEIEHMAISTSNYFRYIFRHNQDFVRLEDEMDHVRIYLDIQKHRYPNSFSYSMEQADLAAGAMIPPLVLQTFIENTVKYAVSREQMADIRIMVDRRLEGKEETTIIRITDTGPGFPPHILTKLIHGQALDQTDGNHIGIMNTLRRLEFLYHNKAKVLFSNKEDGGACVTLYLPSMPKEQPGEEPHR